MDEKISVEIVMGSDSDLPVMQETANILDKFSIGYEINIISSHRIFQQLINRPLIFCFFRGINRISFRKSFLIFLKPFNSLRDTRTLTQNQEYFSEKKHTGFSPMLRFDFKNLVTLKISTYAVLYDFEPLLLFSP